MSRTYARSVRIKDDNIDGYARNGVVLSRDAAHMVIASLRRDSYEHTSRGGDANNAEAVVLNALAQSIATALSDRPDHDGEVI